MSSNGTDPHPKDAEYETVTRYGRKKFGGGWWVSAAVVPALLTVFVSGVASNSIEDDLSKRTRLALAEAGFSPEAVSFDGRDAKITGTEADEERVKAVVEKVDGVRLASLFDSGTGPDAAVAAGNSSPTADDDSDQDDSDKDDSDQDDSDSDDSDKDDSDSDDSDKDDSDKDDSDSDDSDQDDSDKDDSDSDDSDQDDSDQDDSDSDDSDKNDSDKDDSDSDDSDGTVAAGPYAGLIVEKNSSGVSVTLPVADKATGTALTKKLQANKAIGKDATVDFEVDEDAKAASAARLVPFVAALAAAPEVKAKVTDGTLTLSGTADSAKAHEKIVALAKKLDANLTVDDQIEVVDPTKTCTATVPELAASADALDINFRTGSARVIAQSIDELRAFAKVLAGCSHDEDIEIAVIVEGHADSVGSEAPNKALSLRRAGTVKRELVRNGVNGEVITTQGFGTTKPIADNDTAAGRAKNRRVEIVVK